MIKRVIQKPLFRIFKNCCFSSNSALDSNIALLRKYKLDEKACLDISKNKFICEQLHTISSKISYDNLSKHQGHLVYTFVARSSFLNDDQRLFVCEYIIAGNIRLDEQIERALAFFRQAKNFSIREEKNRNDFECFVGLNVSYSHQEIENYVDKFMERHKNEVEEKPNSSSLIAQLKAGLKLCEPRLLFECYTQKCKILKRLGNSLDKYFSFNQNENKSNEKNELKSQQAYFLAKEENKISSKQTSYINSESKEQACNYKPDDFFARDLSWSINSTENLALHESRVGKAVITRFPPEPNGFLHIGHCKAMLFNFKTAADLSGRTILRYDDSNPETESVEYIEQIYKDLRWMGHQPCKVTFASDYFEQIFSFAVELTKKGLAFVCLLPPEQARLLKEARQPSPFRNRPIEENLADFSKMARGEFGEGEAVLRAKIDFSADNPCLRDPVIYRIKLAPHPKTGEKYKVYPIYDFVHPLCDSLEDVTHSLCTLEFECRRELYYWPLEVLDLYKPRVWEFSRLNITYNVVSKRKLLQLISKGLVDDWDDPRLMTIKGLKRRGYPAASLNAFCDAISVTRRGNDKFIDFEFFEHIVRDFLKKDCPRAFCVLHPIPLEISNFKEHAENVKHLPLLHNLAFEKQIFVDASDVRLTDVIGFFGIAPGKIVRLRYGPYIKIIKFELTTNKMSGPSAIFETKENGFADKSSNLSQTIPAQKISKIIAEVVDDTEIDDPKAVKGILHWLPSTKAINFEGRLFQPLFNAKEPGIRTGNFLDDINLESKQILKGCLIHEELLKELKEDFRVQFERVGYFAIDKDTDLTNRKIVFNRIVTLKDKKKEKVLKNEAEPKICFAPKIDKNK